FDFAVAGQGLVGLDAQSLGGLQLGPAVVVDGVLADQPGRFLRHPVAVALQSILRMDTVMFASGHDRLPVVVLGRRVAEAVWRGVNAGTRDSGLGTRSFANSPREWSLTASNEDDTVDSRYTRY